MSKLKSAIVFTLSIFLLISCSSEEDAGVKGEGSVVSVVKPVESFNRLKIEGVFNVYLNQDKTEKVRIEAEQNIIDLISVENDGKTLMSDYHSELSISKSANVDLYITVSDLKELDIEIVGDVETKNSLDLSKFLLTNNSVGNVDFSLLSKKFTVINNSVGDLNLFGLVEKFTLDNNSVGNVNAFPLTAEKVLIENNSVGNININATYSIDIENNGVGNITYKGNPEKRNIENNALGKVEEKK
jgi:hypothetical protein